MSIETEADRAALVEVGRVVKLTLDALEAAVRPGVTTGDLDRIAAGDAARTVVVEGASDLAIRLRGCAESAFVKGAEAARAGVRVNEIGRAVEREVQRCGFTVAKGLAGHGIGRTIHESPNVGNEFDPAQTDVLTAGLVITIEPMITAGSGRVRLSPDGWTIRTRDGSLAAHHEHTMIVTHGAPVLLTASAER